MFSGDGRRAKICRQRETLYPFPHIQVKVISQTKTSKFSSFLILYLSFYSYDINLVLTSDLYERFLTRVRQQILRIKEVRLAVKSKTSGLHNTLMESDSLSCKRRTKPLYFIRIQPTTLISFYTSYYLYYLYTYS